MRTTSKFINEHLEKITPGILKEWRDNDCLSFFATSYGNGKNIGLGVNGKGEFIAKHGEKIEVCASSEEAVNLYKAWALAR